MHLKEDIYKKLIFSPKTWQSPKFLRFLSITLFRRIFHNSTYDFRNPHKITDFLIPMKAYFEQKKFDPIKGILSFFWRQKSPLLYYANSQNTEKCLFYFVLRILILIQSYVPLSWILKKVKIWPTLLGGGYVAASKSGRNWWINPPKYL